MASQETTKPNEGAMAPAPLAGQVARQEFGAEQLMVQAETASAAVAAQAQAVVQARYVMALRNPRDIDDVRVRMLAECKRPGFAEVARYSKPVGGGSVQGFSIRFAEAAARCMKNILCEVQTVWDDASKRIVRVSVTDLESNLTYPKDVLVEKTVERKKVKQGQKALATRINSYGDPVYILQATDDEVLTKENNLVSKALRNSILRLIPGDVLDEAEAQIQATLNNRAAQDPAAERKKLADAFAALGVMPSDLKGFLGHELGAAGPAEIVRLRSIYSAIKGGETTWPEVMEDKGGPRPVEKGGLDNLTEKLAGQGQQPAPAAAAKDCPHPNVAPSKLAALPSNRSIVCDKCGEDLRGEAAPVTREPGDDDDPEPAAPAAENPRAAVEGVAKAAQAKGPRQQRLQD